jgi:calcium-activated chloride channel regulator 3/4
MGYVKKIWVLLLVLALSLALAAPSFAGKWFTGITKDGQTIPFSAYGEDDPYQQAGMATIFQESTVPAKIHLTMTFLAKDGELVQDLTDYEKYAYQQVFWHASQAIHQMTQGAHILGNVRIFMKGHNKMHSDILWTRTTEDNVHPGDWYRARVNGYGHVDKHVYFYDVAQGHVTSEFYYKLVICLPVKSPGNVRTLFHDEKFRTLGYILAHEIGHYIYGLFDEYPFACQGYTPVRKSIMNNGPWIAPAAWRDPDHPEHFDFWKQLNFSIPFQGDLLCDWGENPDPDQPELCDWMDTQNTRHHELMRESGWETLIRPPNDRYFAESHTPGDWYFGLKRELFPELASFMPPRGEGPVQKWYFGEPNVIWMTDDNIFQIVIDRSGSMNPTMMSNAKEAAKLLVDIAEFERFMIGVISFAGDVRVDVPLMYINDEADKEYIKGAIDNISSGGMTAIGDAAYVALDGLLGLNRPDAVKSVFLLTDGFNNRGRNPYSVIPLYQEAQIPLFTFSYGSNADFKLMEDMAVETGGETFKTPTSYVEISRAFERAFRIVEQSQGIASGGLTINAGESEIRNFYVDSTIGELNVGLRFYDEPEYVSVKLLSPNGENIEPSSEGYFQEMSLEGYLYDVSWYYYGINKPDVGWWTLEMSADASQDVFFSYEVSGTHHNTPITLNVATSKTTNPFYYPEPVFLVATLSGELPITGASVEAIITYPDGSSYILPMQDELGDGTYVTLLPYTENGTYEVEVNAYDFEGEAMLTAIGLEHAPDIDGPVAPPDPKPLGVLFQRSGSINVKVEGVQDDDHGNYPEDATAILADNEGVEGRIDYADDVDVFSFVAPESESKLIARLFPIGEWDVVVSGP